MSLRRGFKAAANRISIRLRRGFGLRPDDPIDLRAIATRLKVPLVSLSAFADSFPNAVKQLSIADRSAFSAATIPIDNGMRIIIFNDSHDPGRQNNSIAHEISHILLGHQWTLPIDSSGKRFIDREIEEEANWLGATILISDEAALRIVRDRLSTQTACKLFGVSAPLLKMRCNASGAVIRARRSGAYV